MLVRLSSALSLSLSPFPLSFCLSLSPPPPPPPPSHVIADIGSNSYGGVGGLPASKSTQTVVSLLSGGMDSPVASFMMMRRGCHVVLVHFQNHLQMESAVKDKILRIAKRLSHYQDHITLYVVPFAETQAQIIEQVPGNERMLVYRRFMVKIASHIAQQHRAKFLVLGDSFSQVASQTVNNLAAIYERSERPILSPLMGMNKEETMAIARKIRTFDLSALPYGDCCSYFMDAHPALHLRGERVPLDDFMALLPTDQLIQRAYETMEVTKIHRCEGVVHTRVMQAMVRGTIAPHLQALLDKVSFQIHSMPFLFHLLSSSLSSLPFFLDLSRASFSPSNSLPFPSLSLPLT